MPLAYPRRRSLAAAALAAACLAFTAAPAQAGPVRGAEWWLASLHVKKAWQSSRGAGVIVAVLDTGVDPGQPDLAGSVISGPDYTASGRVPGGPYWGLDGTAAASLIAGHGHGRGGREGIVGIAPAARILAVRVTLENDDPLLADPSIASSLPSAIARGIRYAVRQHAGVIDLPLDPAPTPGAPGAGGSATERSAVAYALARGVVLVAPAGDGGQAGNPVDFPAAYPGVISVGAFDSSFTQAAFSSQQPYVTLTAPGAGVVAAQPGPGYTTINSTTAASAVVAGIAALIRAQFPRLTPAQVEQALTQGARHRQAGGRSVGAGYGTADAAAALSAAAGISEAIPSPAPSPTPTTSAAQAPRPPAVHTTPAPSLGRVIAGDAAIAVGLFFAVIAAILGWGWLRRRRARAARLAQVRAAAQAPAQPPQALASANTADSTPATGADTARAAPASSPGAPFAPASFPGDLAPVPFPGDPAAPAPAQADPFAATSIWGDPADPASHPGDPSARSAGDPFARPAGAEAGPGPGRGADSDGRAVAGALPARPVITGVVLESTADPWRPGAPAAGAELARIGPASREATRSEPGRSGTAEAGSAGPNAPAGGTPGVSGIAAMRTLSAHRIAAARIPKVSGSPPWEPAAEPDGEVPWARPPQAAGAPGPAVGPDGQLPQRRPRSELSVWDVIAQEVWPGGPRESRDEARAPGAAEPPQAEAPKPIYLWNPGATTDTFPAIRPDDSRG